MKNFFRKTESVPSAIGAYWPVLALAVVLFAGHYALARWASLRSPVLCGLLPLTVMGLWWLTEKSARKIFLAFAGAAFAANLLGGIWMATAGGQTSPQWLVTGYAFIWAVLVISLAGAALVSIPVGGGISSRVVKALKTCLLILSFLFPFLLLIHWSLGGGAVSSDTVVALLQTNPQEAAAYFKSGFSIWRTACVLLFAWGVFYLCRALTVAGPVEISRKAVVCFCLLALALGGFAAKRLKMNPMMGPVVQAMLHAQEVSAFGEQGGERQKMIAGLVRQDTVQDGVFVLVIGESLNRNYMSAYGYPEPSTPWQASLRQKSNAVFLENAYSCHTQTVQTLTYALTAKNQYEPDTPLAQNPSLLDIASASGLKTFWISNQSKFGVYDTAISVIASQAGKSEWTGEKYDESLIPVLGNLTPGKRALVIVHLMGHHDAYRDRYPKEYENFSQAENIHEREYLNSVRYNDEVMRQIYSVVSAWPDFSAMVYLSDHGEDVATFLRHDSSHFTWPMTKIPLYAVFSDAYLAENAAKKETLLAHAKMPFTNDLLFETMLGIMGLTQTPYYRARYDLSSSEYDRTRENSKTLYGRIDLTEEGNEGLGFHLQRWLPRKLQFLGKYF